MRKSTDMVIYDQRCRSCSRPNLFAISRRVHTSADVGRWLLNVDHVCSANFGPILPGFYQISPSPDRCGMGWSNVGRCRPILARLGRNRAMFARNRAILGQHRIRSGKTRRISGQVWPNPDQLLHMLVKHGQPPPELCPGWANMFWNWSNLVIPSEAGTDIVRCHQSNDSSLQSAGSCQIQPRLAEVGPVRVRIRPHFVKSESGKTRAKSGKGATRMVLCFA